jgi:predicted metal-dependent hydrolase
MPNRSVEVEIAGRLFTIEHVSSPNKNAVARLKDGRIVISLPSRWPAGEKRRVAESLRKRAIRAIERGKWKPETSRRLEFFDGQMLSALGRELMVWMVPGRRFGCRMAGGRLEIAYVPDHPERSARASMAARKAITEAFLPEITERVRTLNERHFGSLVGKVSLRDNISRWGSCSPDGSISLSMRLLFMPAGILDYVIIHELAHTRYRSHGKRFWGLVGKALPDYLERREWLRENGWRYPEQPDRTGQQDLAGYIPEEPY